MMLLKVSTNFFLCFFNFYGTFIFLITGLVISFSSACARGVADIPEITRTSFFKISEVNLNPLRSVPG